MKKDKFTFVKERLTKRFTKWAEKHMSTGAEEVFIKSVTQATPTYVMGIFKLPTMLCEEMTQMIRYFLRGEEAG
jgi:hypothetical protein